MFAHSVKNPQTIHYFLYGGHKGIRPDTRKWTRYRYLVYLCIQSQPFTTPSKRTRDVSKVTCLNCLRELRKRGFFPGAARGPFDYRGIK